MDYFVDGDVAVMYGLNEAVFIRNALHNNHLRITEFNGAIPANTKVLAAVLPFFSASQIETIVASLIRQGVVEKFSPLPQRIKKYVAQPKTQHPRGGHGYFNCEWCSESVPILHEHHYPVRKSCGGLDTVSICPNCHTEYHFISAGLLRETKRGECPDTYV